MWQALYAPHLKDIVRSLNIASHNGRLSSSTHLCFGRKGSLRICVNGAKAGLWYDFENGVGGNILQLIRKQLNCSFLEATKFADQFTTADSLEQGRDITSDFLQDFSTSQEYLRPLLYHSAPLKKQDEHIGMTYIREKRKIDTSTLRMHSDIRAIPAHIIPCQDYPALFSCARRFNNDSDKDITGGQIIFLNKNGGKAQNQPIQKKSVGKIAGSFVCTQRAEQSEVVFLAEGVETALTIAQCFPKFSVFASLGLFNYKNFRNFAHSDKKTSTIILCEDHDLSNNSATIDEAYRILSQDFDVYKRKPKDPGDDFNDVLQKSGSKAVQDYFKDITEVQHYFEDLEDNIMDFVD